MNGVDILECKRALESKWAELAASQHKAEDIVIERVADSMDELVQATQRDLTVDALNREAMLLRAVSGALERINSGAYGICLQCEEPISARRLAALPWAVLCLTCQEAVDQQSRDPFLEMSISRLLSDAA